MSGLERRSIGALEISGLGLGCNNFGARMDSAAADAVVSAALEAGVNFFDTADYYGGTRSEQILGEVLSGRRSQVILATKFGLPIDGRPAGGSPGYVREAIDASLQRLRTDYVDLFYLHLPDPATPIGDTLAAMDELVLAGKVREIGCSNFSAAQLREAAASVRGGAARVASLQNYFNLLRRDDEIDVLPACADLHVGYVPYLPLAGGVLTGKYRLGVAPPPGTRLAVWENPFGPSLSARNMEIVDRLAAFADNHQRSLLELALSWTAGCPAVASVIVGASTPEQVRANVASLGWEMTADERAAIDALTRPD